MNATTSRSPGAGHGHTRATGAAGQATLTLALAVVAALGAVALLGRTLNTARAIDAKTASIATSAEGINSSTKAIIKLNETDRLGQSILATAEPLEDKLADVVRLAQSIDATVSSINGSATAINGTAKGINGSAAGILQTAQSINRGIEQINKNVEVTLALIQQIKADTQNIIAQAGTAHRLGSCIDGGLPGGRRDGHCG